MDKYKLKLLITIIINIIPTIKIGKGQSKYGEVLIHYVGHFGYNCIVYFLICFLSIQIRVHTIYLLF